MTRIETPHGPIECRYDGTNGFHVGDRVRGYGWPQRRKLDELDLLALTEPVEGRINFMFAKSAYVLWDNGFGLQENYSYLERIPDK